MSNREGAVKQFNKVNDYKKVFTTPEGKRVLMDLMHTHHMLSPVYIKDKDEAVYRDGERNVVLRILTKLKIDITGLKKFIDEEEITS